MSLSFIGPSGAHEALWLRYALLRDNVLHHLDRGVPSDAFSALYGVAAALGGGPVKLSAAKLLDEARRAREALIDRPLSELAVSARTAGALALAWPMPPLTTTIVGTMDGLPGLHRQPRTLGDLLEPLIDALCDLAAPRGATDVVEVHDT